MNISKDFNLKFGSNITPFLVTLSRGSSVESIHRVHAVICDKRGRILMKAGDSSLEAFIRSAQKPFQALPFISSGAVEKMNCGDKGLSLIHI